MIMTDFGKIDLEPLTGYIDPGHSWSIVRSSKIKNDNNLRHGTSMVEPDSEPQSCDGRGEGGAVAVGSKSFGRSDTENESGRASHL